ncbi:hypothetical protein ACFYW9_22955 [Streptomyces sp. NPDC002698]|uniref:hypothetical protein n=1 Tax=Streptomyces sp. NPDC002698 TaxID=3364660 RepID=UPI00367C2811
MLHKEWVHESLHTERIRLARHLLDGGTEGLLEGLGPTVRWKHPRLEISTCPTEHDIHLKGRGLLLIPSYFCWKGPISLADPGLPPVLIYSLHHEVPTAPSRTASESAGSPPLQVLLGRARAAVLQATAAGVTTTEISPSPPASVTALEVPRVRDVSEVRTARCVPERRVGPYGHEWPRHTPPPRAGGVDGFV